jgi:site-specific DNA recombinase
MSEKRTAVKFDRVSSEDQRDGFSLEAQGTLGDKYAIEKNLNVVRSWSVDESASKENNRKHFFELVDFIKQNGIKDVIFDKVDRALRGLKSAVIIEELVETYGVRLHFTREHLILDKDSPPQEKFRFYLSTVMAKYYIDNLKSEINKGMEARREAGMWNHKAPFGYKNIRNPKAMTVPDETQAPLVKEIFDLYSTGSYPYSHFVDFLKQKITDRLITKRLIEEMIRNPFYYGHMKSKGQVLNGAHEPLISKELWDKCQKILGLRAAFSQSTRKGVIPKALMGFMSCGLCDHAVTGESHKKASGKVYIYYHCANQVCPERKRNVAEEVIFSQVAEAFVPFSKFTREETKYFVETLHGQLQDFDAYTQKNTNELTEKRAEIKRNMETLDKFRANGVLSETEHRELRVAKERALNENTDEIIAYQKADLATFKEGTNIIELFHKAYNFMRLENNTLEKVKLAKIVLSNPKLVEGTLRFHYVKPFDVLLDLPGVPEWWRRRELNPRPKALGRKAATCLVYIFRMTLKRL